MDIVDARKVADLMLDTMIDLGIVIVEGEDENGVIYRFLPEDEWPDQVRIALGQENEATDLIRGFQKSVFHGENSELQ